MTKRKHWAILFTLCFPTILTWAYFIALDNGQESSSFQQTAYTVGKAVQFAFPAVWVLFFLREPFGMKFSRGGAGLGFGFGLVVAAIMVTAYFGWLRNLPFFDAPAEAIREKVLGIGITAAWHFVLLSVFYSLIHSFMEEYYWRWFVFRQLHRDVSLGIAITISGLGFMAHHVIVLATYFGWTSPVSWAFSFCVAIGGAVWAWIYHRHDSIVGPWLSHLLVDAAIFLIGYDLIFRR